MTSQLSEIEPKYRLRLMDLVEAAGVDVSDWANCKGGKKNAARNPKHCYEWSFENPGKLVILTLWHHLLEEDDAGTVVRRTNEREFAKVARTGPEKRRALKMDDAMRTAFQQRLSVRAIVQSGRKSNPREASLIVSKRLLDSVEWRVTSYNPNTGAAVVSRGATRFVDQFSIPDGVEKEAQRREVAGSVFIRDALVRTAALQRANGRCEWCGKPGFVMDDGRIYLETHHVVALSEGGPDIVKNVAALCPNHHREAHFGKSKDNMRQELLQRISGTR